MPYHTPRPHRLALDGPVDKYGALLKDGATAAVAAVVDKDGSVISDGSNVSQYGAAYDGLQSPKAATMPAFPTLPRVVVGGWRGCDII